jgi:hypothetical protein
MKKIIHAIAVFGPITLSGAVLLFLPPLLFGWAFIPYNGYVWCGVLTAACLSVCLCAKSDYKRKKIPRIEENGILILASMNAVLWIYIWSVIKDTVIFPFGVICMAFTLYIAVKLCDDTVKRTLALMLGTTLSLHLIVLLAIPLLSPLPLVKDKFSVYNGQGAVAKATVIRDSGNVYIINVIVKKTGADFGLGRFERGREIPVIYKSVNTADYKKPQLVWEGMDLYIDGVKEDIR